jgi:hypothetical protein
MSKSLAHYLPALAAVLGEKPATLYERQRELIREGLLQALPGRGPGAGVQATPEAVAMLLIGMLSDVGLTGSGPRTRAIATPHCVDAVARILADPALAEHVTGITVAAEIWGVVIGYDDRDTAAFGASNLPPYGRAIRWNSSIDGATVRALAAVVAKLGASDSKEGK